MAVNITLEADEELAWRATQEVEAFEELYRRYKLTVYRYHLAKTGSGQVAQDLMSQTFLAAFESITSYDFRGRFVSWLFRIAHKILEEHLRRWDFSAPRFTTPGFSDNARLIQQSSMRLRRQSILYPKTRPKRWLCDFLPVLIHPKLGRLWIRARPQ